MRGNRRRRQRSSTTTLIVTFLLGIGIGYSLHYAQVEISGPRGLEGGMEANAPAADPEDGSGQAAPAESSADVERLWPARHLFIGVQGTELSEADRALLQEYKPGGVILREQNLVDEAQTRTLVREIKEAAGLGLGVPALPLIAVAQESGAANPLRIEGLPTAAEIGADERAARQAGRDIAAAARARDIAVVLAPVLEVAPAGLEGDARARFFSNDPATVAEVGLAFADALLEGGALPVVKHYPGYGAATPGSALATLAERDTQELARLMYPFGEAAEAELPGLLVGHVMVPAVDSQAPASLSPGLVSKIIRDMWQYSGVILADDVTITGNIADRRPEDAAAEALIAGCDAVIALDVDRDSLERITAGILDVVNAKLLTRESLQASKARLDAWRDRIQALPVRIDPPEPEATPMVFDSPVEAPEEEEEEAPETPPVPEVEAEAGAAEAPASEDAEASTDTSAEDGAETAETPAAEEAEEAPAEPLAENSAPEEERAVAPADEPEEEASDAPEVSDTPEASAAAAQPPGTRRVRHRIERGETLTGIADRYGTTVSKLRAWNDLDDSEIKWGFTLTVYVPDAAPPPPRPVTPPAPEQEETPAPDAAPEEPEETAPEAETASEEEGPAAAADSPPPAPSAGPLAANVDIAPPPLAPARRDAAPAAAPEAEQAPATPTSSAESSVREHRLANGETLEEVAEMYGVTKAQILDWNNLLVDTPEPGYLLKVNLPVAVED